MARNELSKLSRDLKPYIIPWIEAAGLAAGSNGATGGSGASDHGVLTGLGDNDHPQYLLRSGGTMSGDIDMDGGNIDNVGLIDGFDINAFSGTLTSLGTSVTQLSARTVLAGDGITSTLVLLGDGSPTVAVDMDHSFHWTGVHYHDDIARSETMTTGASITGWRLQPDGRGDIATLYTNVLYADALDLDGNLVIASTVGIRPDVDTTTLDLIQDAAGATILRVDTTNKEILIPYRLGVGANAAAPSSDIEAYGPDARVEVDAYSGNPALRWARNTTAEWDLLYDVSNTRLAFNEVGVGDALYLKDGGDVQFINHVGIGGDDAGYDLRVVGTTNLTGAVGLESTLHVSGTVTAATDLSVGDDLTVVDAATIGGLFTAEGDVVLPYWEIDSASGVMQTAGAYAFQEPGATADYVGIRFTPSSGAVESAYMSASRLATEVLVFEMVTVNAGDLVIAKSGGRLREAASFGGKKYLTDDAGNRIVDDAGNYVVINDAGVQFTIKLEDPPVGGQLLEPGDQIKISGRPTTTIWSQGSGFPVAINRFFPAERVSGLSSELPVSLKAVVVSAVEGTSNEYVVVLRDNVYYESITFPAGAGVANYGQSGDAYLSLATRNKRAFMDIGRLPGTDWDDDLTPFIRLGDIGGLTNVAEPTDVGLVGGDVLAGVDEYFKIAQSGIVLHNGDHVIADGDGVRRVLMSTTGLSIKLYEDALETLVDLDDIFNNDELYQSAVTWVDDVDNPDYVYGALYAYRDTDVFARVETFTGLQARKTADIYRATAVLAAGRAEVRATDGAESALIANAGNFAAITAPAISLTGSMQIALNGPLVLMTGLPTSSAGLPAGAVWNDGGTLKVVA